MKIDNNQTILWNKIAAKKIYFGHQSVGLNIIQGIQDLMKNEHGARINIIQTADSSQFTSGIFAHSPVGKNDNPESKIEDFVEKMDNGIGQKADIAFFKFCYVDINASTDVEKLFNSYKNALKILQGKYPRTTFVHSTIPLMRKTGALKLFIKTLLGKDDTLHNIARNEYNDLIRNEYGDKEPLFDIASIESTYPDGKTETFRKNGKTYYALVPLYTEDGGHLNSRGSQQVARQLLILLQSL